MSFEGNPFYWGFVENRSMETLAKRAKAKYNEPRETVEEKPNGTPYEEFVSQDFGTSPNPAFVIGAEPIDPMPFLPLTKSDASSDTKDEENCEDDKIDDGTKSEDKTDENVDTKDEETPKTDTEEPSDDKTEGDTETGADDIVEP